jgi:hypothetical protein
VLRRAYELVDSVEDLRVRLPRTQLSVRNRRHKMISIEIWRDEDSDTA